MGEKEAMTCLLGSSLFFFFLTMSDINFTIKKRKKNVVCMMICQCLDQSPEKAAQKILRFGDSKNLGILSF